MYAEIITHTVSATDNIIYLVGAILGGGVITAIVSWYKFTKQGAAQKEEIITEAAKHAVDAMQKSLGRLESELGYAQSERERLQRLLREAVEDRAILNERVRVLSNKITELEREVTRYKTLLQGLKVTDMHLEADKKE